VDPKNDTLENLATYICRYASEFLANSQSRCEFMIPTKLPDHRLSTEVRHNVFLAVKEVLNNAVKHAAANRVTLKLIVRSDEFEINIADDGRGIAAAEGTEPGRIKRTGHGLTNLKERLASIHGRLELNSEAGRGMEVRLIVPLQEKGETVSSIYPTRDGSI
jgi:signal transduction histidine kinase